MKPFAIHSLSALVGFVGLGSVLSLMSLMQTPGHATRIHTLSPEEQEILSHLSIVYLTDGAGAQRKTVRLTGANLQIVNGLGATNGNPAMPEATDATMTNVNGLGNLIVGYNELGVKPVEIRPGSHNLVLGQHNGYESFGALIGGRDNVVRAPYAAILGGENNNAHGEFSAVVGGEMNMAVGDHSVVSGGLCRTALGAHDWVAGSLTEDD